jgi:hypothetical protein
MGGFVSQAEKLIQNIYCISKPPRLTQKNQNVYLSSIYSAVDKNKKHVKNIKLKYRAREGSRAWAHSTVALCRVVIAILTVTPPSVAAFRPASSCSQQLAVVR